MGVIVPIKNPNPPVPGDAILTDGSYLKVSRVGPDFMVVRHLTRFGANLDAYRLTKGQALEFMGQMLSRVEQTNGDSGDPASAAGGPGPSPDPTRD